MMRTIIIIAIVLSASVAVAYTPQYLEQKKQECTFAGEVNQGCVDLFTEVVSGDNPLRIKRDLEDTLRTCFRNASDFEKRHADTFAVAAELLARQDKQDPAVANKYVTACLDATSAVRGGTEWMTAAKYQAFIADLADSVRQQFSEKCGVRAQLSTRGVATIVLMGKPSKHGVFYKGGDSGGGTMTIDCAGVIVGKTAAGKSYRVAPKSQAEVNAARSKTCVQGCEMTDTVACDPSTGHVSAACEMLCKRQCE